MKKLLFTLLSITLLFSCQDPVIGPGFPDEDPNNNSESNFQVDFDNQTFISDQITATNVGGIINITGFRGANGEAVILSISGNSTGNYDLGTTGSNLNGAVYLQSNGSTTPFVSETGEIIISEINTNDKTLSGTFNFTGVSHIIDSNGNPQTESQEFTNGKFTNITYTDDLVTGGNNDNTFFAKVDGVEFVEDNFSGTVLNFAGMSSIGISAVNNSLVSIGFSLPSTITPGTYDLTSLGEIRGMYNISTTNINGAKSGTITISSHNTTTKHIVATFDFIAGPLVGTTEYAITDGEFELTYQ